MRALAIAAVVAALGVSVGAQLPAPQSPDRMMGDDLYSAYLSSGPAILSRAFPTNQRFEEFRKNFNDHVFQKWGGLARERSRAMFMFDVALAAFPSGYLYWADFFQLGQTYLRKRPATMPIGAVPELDAFELQWNKTAIAFLAGRRTPDLVDTLARPLIAGRIIPAPSSKPALVDPWIALLAGFVEEGYFIEDPKQVDRVPKAISAYQQAVAFESTRAEATVRVARLLVESNRPSEAIAALDKSEDSWTSEAVVIYWSRLVRGKALAALDRTDEAIRAYVSALEIIPSAQSPRMGIMALEARRGRSAVAETISRDIRTAPDPVNDPWWMYPHGDIRFFPAREKTLREMAPRSEAVKK